MQALRRYVSGRKAAAAARATVLILSFTMLFGGEIEMIGTEQWAGRGDSLDLLLLSHAINYSLGDGVMLPMVKIQPGEFDMGSSTAGQLGSGSDEGPVRRVTITSGFEMSQFEVTREAFGKIMGWKKLDGCSDWPVTGVDFDDCCLFCNRLSERFGLDKCYVGWGKDLTCDFAANGFRLPTEGEWEYASRAGTRSLYATGDEAFGDCEQGEPRYLQCAAWFKNNSNGRVHSVGELAPNAFGLCDMHGNVWEWCWDFYDDHYASAPAVDPRGPDSGTQRVVRGGCYTSHKEDCRSAARGRLWPGKKDPLVGFRVVRRAVE
ncbi:MAG: SUMF1/EgtB/PvdO family nonheme iron enzyme [Candidatus Coatesbacteria bacterium]|nr:SUMF1/EgtB/PvdO family nonheme iron enzyme [Candidatus Coatesbacteria bacterium]